MSDAPERIWAEKPDIFDDMGLWHGKHHGSLTEYVRADLVTPPQITDAMVDAAIQGYSDVLPADGDFADAMRAALAAAMMVQTKAPGD